MRRKLYIFVCDSCGAQINQDAGFGLVRVIRMIRRRGWTVSRDRRSCLCPYCSSSSFRSRRR